MLSDHASNSVIRKFEDTKGVIRSCKSLNDRQYNGQVKNDKQYNGQAKNDRQYNGQAKNDRQYNGQEEIGQNDKQWSTKHYTEN